MLLRLQDEYGESNTAYTYLNEDNAWDNHSVFMYTNGEKLDGEWNGSAYPDYGIYTYANGDRYGGSWRQGKKHGVGTYYFGSGAKYQGEYRDGNPHGRAEKTAGAAGLFRVAG